MSNFLLSLAVLLSTPLADIPTVTASKPAPEETSLWDTASLRCAPPPCPAPGLTLHIPPQGNDTGPGTAGKPFATLEISSR